MDTSYMFRVCAFTSKGPGPWGPWLQFHMFNVAGKDLHCTTYLNPYSYENVYGLSQGFMNLSSNKALILNNIQERLTFVRGLITVTMKWLTSLVRSVSSIVISIVS